MDGTFGSPHLIRDAFDRTAFQLNEPDCLAIVRREGPQRVGDGRHSLPLRKDLVGRLVRAGRGDERRSGDTCGIALVDAGMAEAAAALGCAVCVDHAAQPIERDGGDPAAEGIAAARLEAADAADDFELRVLHDVIGVDQGLKGAGDAVGDAGPKTGRSFGEKFLERAGIPGDRACDASVGVPPHGIAVAAT